MSLLKVLAVLVVLAPLSIFATFALSPLWNWVETRFGIESVGHAMYAGWCFVATYAVIALLAFALLAWPTRRTSLPD